MVKAIHQVPIVFPFEDFPKWQNVSLADSLQENIPISLANSTSTILIYNEVRYRGKNSLLIHIGELYRQIVPDYVNLMA